MTAPETHENNEGTKNVQLPACRVAAVIIAEG